MRPPEPRNDEARGATHLGLRHCTARTPLASLDKAESTRSTQPASVRAYARSRAAASATSSAPLQKEYRMIPAIASAVADPA
ncbi:hypothetical protein FB108_1916 [Brevibacterium jeotgali]|nr:hypothetical protein FB108_1916 [Brevibacterium jeotgali]